MGKKKGKSGTHRPLHVRKSLETNDVNIEPAGCCRTKKLLLVLGCVRGWHSSSHGFITDDIYFLSTEAVCTNWKRRSVHTLRHCARGMHLHER